MRNCLLFSSSLLAFGLTACTVSPPDPDSALFACEDDGDCAAGFFCHGGFCQRVGEPEKSCEDVGCSSDQVCVQWSDAPPTCQPRCDDRVCADSINTACITVNGFPKPSQPPAEVRACSSCGGTCEPGTACWPNAPGGAFDEISVSCLPGIRCFDDNGCANGQLCVRDLENPEIGFIGICRPSCGDCNDPAQETCAQLPRFGASGEVGICVPCPSSCQEGEICTWDTGSTSAGCKCDDTRCETVRGLPFRCDGNTCTDQCSQNSVSCRAGALCDDLDGVCRPDCLVAGLSCDPPSACRWTEQPNGDPAYLCVVDACVTTCPDDPTCAFAPFADTPDCEPPICARDFDCGAGRCVTDYQGRGTCRPYCERGIIACSGNELCLPQLARDGLRWVDACASPPDCPGLPVGALCVYADRTLETTAGVMSVCTSTGNCPGGSSCVFSPRAPATLEAQPFGVCLHNPNPSCSSPEVPVARFLFPGAGATTVCAEVPALGEACNEMCGDSMGRCVRMPGGGNQCRPWCSQGELPCLPGESCAPLFEYGSTMPTLGALSEVCVPGLGRYEPTSLSTPTWFSNATLPTTSGPWTHAIGWTPDGPSVHVATSTGGTLIAVNGTNPTPNATILSSAENLCGQLQANAQIGAGEWTDTGRVVRLVATCPPGANNGVCANGNGAWRIVTARVFGAAPPDGNCATAVQVIAEADEELMHGAIGDGYLALVRIRTPGTTPRASIRVGKLVDVRDVGEPQVKIVWAPHEILLNRDWEVQELRVTRDLVAWRMRQPLPPQSGRIGAAPVRQLFAAEPPRVWYSQEALVSAGEVYEGLAAGDHWVAWTRRNTSGGAQQVHWAAVNLADPSLTPTTSSYVTTDGNYVAENWATWVRPSIDGNFLAYTTANTTSSEYKIWVLNLAKSDEVRCINTLATPLGWPLLVSDTAGTGLWVYVVGSDQTISSFTVPRY